MTNPIRFCLVLHNHQPIGNFDFVFEQAYQDSYLPFLDVFEAYPDLRLSLHTSGPLMEWLDAHHPEYLDRLAQLVAQRRIEIIGGPFYEPILTMIPARDRVGQMTAYRDWLSTRLNATVDGMWVPERVWEQGLTADIVDAGVRYTVLDDFHFRNAGLVDDQLFGYYLTEENGRVLNIFPGSERLRYMIPFAPPHETIEYLRGIANRFENVVIVFGDDGEKFGTWPETKQHVYDDGWLRSFFDALSANQHWLHTTTLGDAAGAAAPWGKIYLPDASYREMTEWALPHQRQLDYEDLVHDMRGDARWSRIQQFVRGGFWRNFKVKYPESNEMYARMMMVSRRLQTLARDGSDSQSITQARSALYRGQCNCSYWHGAFGGIYLPHLRNAVYRELITADNLLDRAEGKTEPFVEAIADDFDFDARQEVQLTTDQLTCLLAPARGGRMYELDVRSIGHNLLATLARRPEAYHRKILAGNQPSDAEVASIHDRIVCKQEGLDQRLQYDRHMRKSLLDHFYAVDTTAGAVRSGEAAPLGDFVEAPYQARIRRNPGRVQIQLSRSGFVDGMPVTITKGVTAEAGSSALEIAYLLEGLPSDRTLHFAVEFNFAGMPTHADDRFFHRGDHEPLGPLHTELDLIDTPNLGLIDEWLGLDVQLAVDRPTGWWSFPIETVSLSEGGFELVHQSVVIQPHWLVRGDAEGRWSTQLRLAVDTARSTHQVPSGMATAMT